MDNNNSRRRGIFVGYPALKFWKIVLHELYFIVARKSFWLGLVAFPFIGFVVFGIVSVVAEKVPQDSTGVGPVTSTNFMKVMDQKAPLGFVDQAGIIRVFHETVDPAQLIQFPDQASGLQALAEKRIRGFYVINDMFMKGGPLFFYTDQISPASFLRADPLFEEVIYFNLLEGNQTALQIMQGPVKKVHEINLLPQNRYSIKLDEENFVSFILPIFSILFLITPVVEFSAMILNSFNREAESRVMEVLLCSASVRQILWGKMIALWTVGVLTILIWTGSSAFLLGVGGQRFQLVELTNLSPIIIGWGLVFALLGYFFYGSIMMSIGTFLPYLRETSNILFVTSFIVRIPILLFFVFIEEPDSGLALVLSFIPFTAPTAMVMRMFYTNMPIWQPVVSSLILLVSTAGVIFMVARFFRPIHLLTDPDIKSVANIFKRRSRNKPPPEGFSPEASTLS